MPQLYSSEGRKTVNMRLIFHIIKKEFGQFRRDPKMFGITLVAPVMQLIFLGYAANLDINSVRLIILDKDKSNESHAVINSFDGSEFFEQPLIAENDKEVTEYLENGKVIAAVVIPKYFEKNLERKETASVQVLLNGSDGNTANIAAGYISSVLATYSKQIMAEYLAMHGIQKLPVGQIITEPRVWYNPELRTRYFMVPAIVGLLLSVITLLLTSLAIVKEKELGTLEQLIVTPIKPVQLIIGKLIPFAILGFIAVFLVLTGMRFIFDIPVRGSVVFLYFSSFLYILSTLGLGLFVSTISKTQQQAMMIAVFVILMPMVYLSGFAFPVENMPTIIQIISYAVPLKYFLIIIRGVILKGLGFSDLWMEAVVLFFIGFLILVLSSLRFRKRLE